jgi:hypothetical protein
MQLEISWPLGTHKPGLFKNALKAITKVSPVLQFKVIEISKANVNGSRR